MSAKLLVEVEEYQGDEEEGISPPYSYEVGVELPSAYYESHKSAEAFALLACAAAWWTKDDDDETPPLDWELMQAIQEGWTSSLGQPMFRVSHGLSGETELMSKVEGEDRYLVWANIDASFPRAKLRLLPS